MTTFQTRELIRDDLVTLFTANGSWQSVYGYFPGTNEMKGKTPVLVIRSRGTSQDMAGAVTNPTAYRFVLSSFVLAYSENSADNWTSDDAEDKLDELDKVLRQVIRDNAGGGSYADRFEFEPGYSQVDDIIIEGLPYIVESRGIIARLVRGAV